ncbi:feruloyl-CoA synthase [Paraburkholderia caffeinilytica]|uniref:Feruloyl-CoA synthase n=1 Tax=Paraburkholderia caffeinilytica TaxID=1761016 RepID=A0ABQ1MPR5_9BURK|nr:feruloyl-CoA synthase [Paraburkholderia caffeinilytica]GGC42650.1 feruloyl-CoA synthase [Paraburkholderia caffeinilytica]CAB3797630.1 2-succinylbenzoate--CoA ligase [Paraburkholderia caffeinilytica]
MPVHTYRRVNFGVGPLEVIETADGALRVRSTTPLGPYPERVIDRLFEHAAAAPERTLMARRGPDGQWQHVSYAQAAAAARSIGEALLARGLSAERPVAILSGNSLQHALVALGCMCAGVPYAPVSPAYSLLDKSYGKLRHILSMLTPGLVFADDGARFAAALCEAVPADVEVVVGETPPAARTSTLLDELAATVPTDAVERARAATGPDTIVKFLCTSGSTKMPKAVINTNRMWSSNLVMETAAWPFLAEEPPVFIDWLPWHHTFGGNQNFGLTLFHGGSLYIDDGKPTPDGMATTLANLREISPTVYFNVPKGWEEIARALEQDAGLRATFYHRLRMQFYAGAALEQPVWDRLHRTAVAHCGERIVMNTGLGMTETAPSALMIVETEVVAGQIGVPLPGMELKLVPVGDGQSRKLEVRYRGPNVTSGYWRAPEQSAEAFDEEGFFCSGDAVRWLDPSDPNRGFVFDGRVAEDFKLNTGTWVSVGPLRQRVIAAGSPYVGDVVVTGHDRHEIGILIVPNLAACRQLAGAFVDVPAAQVYAHPEVVEMFRALLDALYSEGTGTSSRVARAALLDPPPSLATGEVTDKGSINQRAVLLQRVAIVDALYRGDATLTVWVPRSIAAAEKSL